MQSHFGKDPADFNSLIVWFVIILNYDFKTYLMRLGWFGREQLYIFERNKYVLLAFSFKTKPALF